MIHHSNFMRSWKRFTCKSSFLKQSSSKIFSTLSDVEFVFCMNSNEENGRSVVVNLRSRKSFKSCQHLKKNTNVLKKGSALLQFACCNKANRVDEWCCKKGNLSLLECFKKTIVFDLPKHCCKSFRETLKTFFAFYILSLTA